MYASFARGSVGLHLDVHDLARPSQEDPAPSVTFRVFVRGYDEGPATQVDHLVRLILLTLRQCNATTFYNPRIL